MYIFGKKAITGSTGARGWVERNPSLFPSLQYQRGDGKTDKRDLLFNQNHLNDEEN